MYLTNMIRKTGILLLTLALGLQTLQAQKAEAVQLNLQEARQFALEHNHQIRSSSLDVDKARYQVKESVSIGLPQVDVSVAYNDNIALPVQLVPGDFFGEEGKEIEVSFGTKYNAALSGTINQLIFSGSYIVGLQAAKTYLQQSQKQYNKSKINVIKSVSEAYFLVLATEEGIMVIDSTLQITQKLADETRLIFQNGFAEETDIDQLDLLIAELEVSKRDAETQLEIAKAYLKFHLGLQSEDEVAPKEQLTELVEDAAVKALLSSDFIVNNNIDFQILKNQQELALLQLKLEKSSYLPELSAFLNYQTQAQRQQWDFFNQSGKWFGSAIFGVNMNIPIFSSGQRSSKVKQAQFDYQKTKVAEEELKTSLSIQYETTLNDLRNALENFENTRKNKAIAEKIFRRTGIKYREGMATSLDLLNTHNQYLSSQSQFINASLQVLNMSVSLESLLTSEFDN